MCSTKYNFIFNKPAFAPSVITMMLGYIMVMRNAILNVSMIHEFSDRKLNSTPEVGTIFLSKLKLSN